MTRPKRQFRTLYEALEFRDQYGVVTKVRLQAVKRNIGRFPEDFMIQLTAAEWAALRSRIVTINSERAIAVNIEIMRAFVKLRELLSSNRELARRFAQLETRLDKKLTEHDEASLPSFPPSDSSWVQQHTRGSG